MKIRIKKRVLKPVNPKILKLINERNELSKKKDDPNVHKVIEAIDKSISDIEALDNREKIIKNFKAYSDNPETINMQEM